MIEPRSYRGGIPVFGVEVSDHVMVAHSFRGAVFGPARRLHGATFAVSACFLAERLDADGIVVDIGRAQAVLRSVLEPLDYRNLDDLPQFEGANTTTEFLAKYLFDRLAEAVREGNLGRAPAEIAAIRVSIAESPSARASYEADLR
jgi:6-pyruvoyl-tetrahydropterin synthase